MLTFIRNYQKGFLVVVTILICAAFGWFLMRSDTTTGRSTTIFTIDKQGVREGVFNTVRGQRWIAETLSLPNYPMMLRELAPSTAAALATEEKNVDFDFGYVSAIILIRQEAKRLGIAISEEEIGKVIESSPAFMTNGQFDSSRFTAFANADASNPSEGIMITIRSQFGQAQQIGPVTLSQRGNSVKDLKEAISDYLLLDKINQTVGGGVQFPHWFAEQNYDVTNQIVIADTITFKTEEMKDKVDVTDEKLTAYFEENRDRYMTDAQRAVQYVHFVDEALPNVPTPQERATMKPEEIEAITDARRKSRNTLGPAADEMLDLLRSGTSFEEAANKLKVDLVTTPPFSISNPPEALASSVRAQELISRLNSEDAPAQVIAEGDSFYVIKLKSLTPSEPKEFDVVKEDVHIDLIAARTNDLTRETANAALEKLSTATISKETSLESLKKSLGIEYGTVATERRLAPDDARMQSMPTSDQSLRYDLLGLPSQGLSEVLPTDGGFTIALVRDRQIERSEDKASQVELTDSNFSRSLQNVVFGLWWADRVAAANPHFGG